MALLLESNPKKTNKKTITSINPATLEVLAELDVFDKEGVDKKVKEAKESFKNWSKLTIKERCSYILAAKDYIVENSETIADLITKENGKPLVESMAAEILSTLDLMTYFCKNAEQMLAKENIPLGKWSTLNKSSHVVHVPLGVIGVISPWNMPFTIPMGQIIMALVSGNTVVLKPSEHTPLIALEIENIFKKANLPKGVFSVITGLGETGAHLVNSGVNKIVFTGSVNTGKKIMASAAKTLTPVVLELGGKDPMIVFKDVNIENAASGAVWGAFTNCGQVCASIERVYVHEDIADEFIFEVARKTKNLKQGNGLDKSIEIGPMISEMQMGIVDSHVEDARKRGAKILTGGERNLDLPGYFYKPTVLMGVDKDFTIVKEETFGPILPIMTYKNEEDAIRMANDSKYGLTASIWTKDIERAKKIAERVEAGTVSINDCITTFALCQTPWGGGKESGIGRTHGKIGLHEFTEPRHIHIDKSYNIKKFWWYGYDKNRFNMFKESIKLLYSGKGANVPKLVKNFFSLKNL